LDSTASFSCRSSAALAFGEEEAREVTGGVFCDETYDISNHVTHPKKMTEDSNSQMQSRGFSQVKTLPYGEKQVG
jgi:hypothetical protein